MSDEKEISDNHRKVRLENLLRRRNRNELSAVKVLKQPTQNRPELISQEERTTIRNNLFLFGVLLCLLTLFWYFYVSTEASKGTITVNLDKMYPSSIYSLCIFSETLLIAADQANQSVKVIDTKLRKLLTTFNTETHPWCVTKVSDSQVAVSLSDMEKIQILSVNYIAEEYPSLTIERNISVKGKPVGIEYWNGSFFVVIANSEAVSGVYILNMDGIMIKSFTEDAVGNKLFHFPVFIALNKQNQIMYVSDIVDNSVTSLTFDGKVKAVYEDEDILQMPGITVDTSGRVYLCRQPSISDLFTENPHHNIYRLSADLAVGNVLFSKSDRINFPTSVAYDDKTKRLYVGSNYNPKIQYFSIFM